MTFEPPNFNGSAFNCPHCAAYAHMSWGRLLFQKFTLWQPTEAFVATCEHCKRRSYWIGKDKPAKNADYVTGLMMYPRNSAAPMPHADMPPDIRSYYEEARDIAGQSPRAAAALLRLCIQKLCKHLGEPGNNINKDIGALVKKGLPVEIQQALDIVRVIGNNAVHPGEISSSDVGTVTASLFDVVNHIVEDRIARPSKLAAMFAGLPAPALAGIARRDKGDG